MKQLFKESIWILVLFVYIFDRYIDKGLNYHTNISEVEFLKCSTIFCSYLLQLVFSLVFAIMFHLSRSWYIYWQMRNTLNQLKYSTLWLVYGL